MDGNLVGFRMDLVALKTLAADRLECFKAYIKCNFCDLNFAAGQPGGGVRRKMQAGGGCGSLRAVLRKHRLVPLAVERLVGSLNIGRQRDVPQAVKRLAK